ncbi:hypothetical protein AAMO2058_001339700 [Amorphochlora amoebiformis]
MRMKDIRKCIKKRQYHRWPHPRFRCRRASVKVTKTLNDMIDSGIGSEVSGTFHVINAFANAERHAGKLFCSWDTKTHSREIHKKKIPYPIFDSLDKCWKSAFEAFEGLLMSRIRHPSA